MRIGRILSQVSWWRFPVAIGLAGVAWLLTPLLFIFIGSLLRAAPGSSSALLWAFCVALSGFNGIFFGGLYLPQADRLFGATVLLILGIGFQILVFGSAHGQFHFPRAVFPTGLGGFLALAVHYYRKRSNRASQASPEANQ